MNAAHWHLVLSHLPIMGILFGIFLLGIGLVRKNYSLQNAGLIIFVLMALVAIPVFLTGEPAEEIVEHLPGVRESLIEEHEELAEVTIWLIGLLGLSSLIAFSFRAINKNYKTLIMVTFIISLPVIGIMAKVANLGGKIRHSEIRGDTPGTNIEVEDDKDFDINKPNFDYLKDL